MLDSVIMEVAFSNFPRAIRGVGRAGGSFGSCKRPCFEGEGSPSKKKKKGRRWRKDQQRSRNLTKSKAKTKKSIRTKPEAPFNSTQFIMDEHDNLNDSDLSTSRPRRHRDSSLSLESEDLEDENLGLSSSEDEKEQFMTQQFWYAYEDFHAERLDSMTKVQLLQEYFALEEKLTTMEMELQAAKEQDRRRIREPSPAEEEEEDIPLLPGEVPVDAETAVKIEIFRSEIQSLEEENSNLRQENLILRRKHSCRCSSNSDESNSSSTSDSDSHSDSNSTSTATGAETPLRVVECVGGELVGSELEISEVPSKGENCEPGGVVGGNLSDGGPDSGVGCSDCVSSSSGEDDLKRRKSNSSAEGGTHPQMNETPKEYSLPPS